MSIRVAVAGAGAMGLDHVSRISTRIAGATVSAVVELDAQRREAACRAAPGARGFVDLTAALDAGAADAVLIATPGTQHAESVLACLRAGLPVLCEKPLTPDPESARALVDAELAGGRRLIQVGFMRRFDAEYLALKELIGSRRLGELLMIHAAHRNAGTPPGYVESMLITDSVVHELDVLPWLAGSPVASIEVRRGRGSPILVLLELADGTLADVEMNVSAAGYQVITEAVLSGGVLRIGADGDDSGYLARFARAYDAQVQAWIDAVADGAATGPSAWDGYAAAVCCRAGVAALTVPGPVPVDLPPRPAFYER